jgi:preprotein translocase subunit SecG
MINTLLFIHLIIALLLIVVILLQKTSTDGLSGIGGGGNNMGLVSGRSAANFLTRTTIVLGTLFFINALILANLSSKPKDSLSDKINTSPISSELLDDTPAESLPIAK